jgi:hypothetical protein
LVPTYILLPLLVLLYFFSAHRFDSISRAYCFFFFCRFRT